MSMIRILSERTVEVLMADELEASFRVCADAYRYYGKVGDVLSKPSSLFLDLPGVNTKRCRLKGAHQADAGIAGFRLASPGSYFTWVIDSETGSPIGLVAENWLHRRRTAVTGALVLSWLRPDLKVIALIGAGKIGCECALMLSSAFPNAKFILGARDIGRGQIFSDSLEGLVKQFTVMSVEQAVRCADAVLTITKADRSFIDGDWLKKGAIALSMGGVPEFDYKTWCRADRFFLDDIGYAMQQGDLHHWVKNDGLNEEEIKTKLTATVGQLALDCKQYENSQSSLTLLIIQGMAVCDIAMAGLALRLAEARGIGQLIDLNGD
jgi:ornithine cyclodeaminase/alanine dehydrogenase-like protein (mu-crystallin family)